MACDKHKIRRQKNCIDCYPEDEVNEPIINVDVLKDAIIEDEIANKQSELSNVKSSCFDEKKYIRELIEVITNDIMKQVKREVEALKSITFEHIHIPLSVFCIALMYQLEAEGWQFKTSIDVGYDIGYSAKEPFFIMTRIKGSNSAPTPDFTNPKVISAYIKRRQQ